MAEYVIEENEHGDFNILFVDEKEEIKDLVAIAYNHIHAKIIMDTFNTFHLRVSNVKFEEDENKDSE